MTLNEHQSHSNWNQPLEFGSPGTPMPSLKQIAWQVSWHTMFNRYFIKSCQQSSLPWIILLQNKFSMSFHISTGCGSRLNFIQTDTQIYKKMDTKVYDFSHNCHLERRSRSPKLASKCRAKWSPSSHKFGKIDLQMSDYMPMLKVGVFLLFLFFFFFFNTEWMRKNKYEVHHTNKSLQHTRFHSNWLKTL